MAVRSHPPTRYETPPRVKSPQIATPPVVYLGDPRDHTRTTLLPNTREFTTSHSSHYPSHAPLLYLTEAGNNCPNLGLSPGGHHSHPTHSNDQQSHPYIEIS